MHITVPRKKSHYYSVPIDIYTNIYYIYIYNIYNIYSIYILYMRSERNQTNVPDPSALALVTERTLSQD